MIQIESTAIVKFLDELYPELLMQLQEDQALDGWIAEMITAYGDAEDEAVFFLQLAIALDVSQHQYLKEILEEDFPQDYQRLLSIGVLKFELMNMAQACAEVFQVIPLTKENEDSRPLRLAVTGVISDYLYQASVA